MSKRGRPRAYIDKKQFESMCALQATKSEICLVLDVTERTLTRWCKEVYGMNFYEIFRQKRELGKMSLRRSQWKLAERSPVMAIWLGKQYLGQKDEQSVEVKTDNAPVINVNIPKQEP